MQNVMERLFKVVGHWSKVSVEDLRPETKLKTVMDSFNIVEMSIGLEDEFERSLDREVAAAETLADLAHRIETVLSASEKT